ncbi:MAG: alpha/beta hydrolase [Clostridia bacterium]|nr:alpha/beta hydrolase [Clostridia bacterium]
MKVLKDVEYGKDEAQRYDVYIPDNKGFKTIIGFHGGGLTGGDKADENYAEVAASFARAGYCFVSVNYRMYPSAKFPQFIEDCAKAVAHAKGNIEKWGGSGEIIISGQSAGGYIALFLCFDRHYLADNGVENKDVSAWVIDSAQPTSHFVVINREDGFDGKRQIIDKHAPLYYVDENVDFSRMLLIYYENDMVCRAEQNLLLFKAIRAYNQTAELETVKLSGGHCAGSCIKDENGEYPFVTVALEFLNK